MTVLLAVSPEETGKQIVQAAASLARTIGDDLVLGVVVPGPSAGDRLEHREYQAHLEGLAREALDRAAAAVPDDVPVRSTVHLARSIPTGIVELAQDIPARVIVTGSASAGIFGRITLGSTTDWLLHGSPVTVFLVPRGAHVARDGRFTRATVAYAGERDDAIALGIGKLVGRLRGEMRLVRFSVLRTLGLQQRLGIGPGSEPERDWAQDELASMQPAVERLRALGEPPSVSAVAVRGESWDEAVSELEWDSGDVLVVGSGHGGTVGQVFLGSKSAKLVRTSPVPVLILPVDRAEVLARDPAALEPVVE